MDKGFMVLPREEYDKLMQKLKRLDDAVQIDTSYDSKRVNVDIDSALIYDIAKSKLDADEELSANYELVDVKKFNAWADTLARHKEEAEDEAEQAASNE